MNKLFSIVLVLLCFGFTIDEVTESHSDGTPKTIKTYKIQNNKLILEREREFYSNGVMKYDRKYRNNQEYSLNSWDRNGNVFEVNLREYYFPIDSFIENPKVYIYENDSGVISDIIKCEAFIEKNGDTLFVSTFYNDFNSPGVEWRELCSANGLLNIDSERSKMINSPLFNYNQKIGESSKSSYYHNNEKVFWERTFLDTLDNMDLVVYKDVFKQNNEVVYSRNLFYKYGVGRVAVYDDYGRLTLEKIIDLKTFQSLQKINE